MRTSIIILLFFNLMYAHGQTKAELEKIEAENQGIIDSSTPKFLNFLWIKKNGEVYLYQAPRRDHRMFGYEKPDVNSKKLILFSIFTKDVNGNPFAMPLGSYYDVFEMEKKQQAYLKYIKTKKRFVEMELVKDSCKTKLYFLKKYTRFDKL